MYDDTVADFYDPRYDGDDPDYGENELEEDLRFDFHDYDDPDEILGPEYANELFVRYLDADEIAEAIEEFEEVRSVGLEPPTSHTVERLVARLNERARGRAIGRARNAHLGDDVDEAAPDDGQLELEC
jgi:hypothetical protein